MINILYDDAECEINPFRSLNVCELDDLEHDLNSTIIATKNFTEVYRKYENAEIETVREFYRLNHAFQRLDVVG